MAVLLEFAFALKVWIDSNWRPRPSLSSCIKSRHPHTNQSRKAENEALLRTPHLIAGCDAFAEFVRCNYVVMSFDGREWLAGFVRV